MDNQNNFNNQNVVNNTINRGYYTGNPFPEYDLLVDTSACEYQLYSKKGYGYYQNCINSDKSEAGKNNGMVVRKLLKNGENIHDKLGDDKAKALEKYFSNKLKGKTKRAAAVFAAKFLTIYFPYQVQYVNEQYYSEVSKMNDGKRLKIWEENNLSYKSDHWWKDGSGIQCSDFVMWSLLNAGIDFPILNYPQGASDKRIMVRGPYASAAYLGGYYSPNEYIVQKDKVTCLNPSDTIKCENSTTTVSNLINGLNINNSVLTCGNNGILRVTHWQYNINNEEYLSVNKSKCTGTVAKTEFKSKSNFKKISTVEFNKQKIVSDANIKTVYSEKGGEINWGLVKAGDLIGYGGHIGMIVEINRDQKYIVIAHSASWSLTVSGPQIEKYFYEKGNIDCTNKNNSGFKGTNWYYICPDSNVSGTDSEGKTDEGSASEYASQGSHIVLMDEVYK